TWIVADEAILITTKEKADVTLNTKLYIVGDLVAATADPTNTSANELGSVDDLIDSVTSIAAADMWSERGGPGTIESYGAGKYTLLAVMQSQQAHEQVADILTQVRDVRHRQQEATAQQPPIATEPKT